MNPLSYEPAQTQIADLHRQAERGQITYRIRRSCRRVAIQSVIVTLTRLQVFS
jgi:hypothetical protein